MGNCQAVDAAALAIQHPNGKLERMYWTVTASEVMKTNPGHYVSLIIPLPQQQVASSSSSAGNNNNNDEDDNHDCKKSTVRFTRVKLLRPSDTLVLGKAYRLVTTQEVMKVLRAKKHAKMRRDRPESSAVHHVQINSSNNNNQEQENIISESETGRSSVRDNQVLRALRHHHHHHHRQSSLVNGKGKLWRPSLQSISENNGNI